MRRHLSHFICVLAVAGLAFVFKDAWQREATACPNHALALRLTEEQRQHGIINTTSFQAVTPAFVEELVKSNAGVCLVSESVSGSLQSQQAFLYRAHSTGKYYLVFDGGLGGTDKAGFGPIEE